MPLRSDPVKTAEANERRKKRNKARTHITNTITRGGVRCIPKWGQDCIADVYAEAKYMQLEVDHIIPLKHPLVCGLHVWDNLQLLTPSQNRRKHNSFDIETFTP